MGQTAQIIPFPKKINFLEELKTVQRELADRSRKETLSDDLNKTLTELFEFYDKDSLWEFVEDCAQAKGNKIGTQADRAVLAWARRQLTEFQEQAKLSG